MILIFIISWALAITTFIIGYLLGRGSFTRETYQQIKQQITHKTYPHFKQPSGIIERPNTSRIHEMNNPKITEEKEAMQAALDEGIEPLTP